MLATTYDGWTTFKRRWFATWRIIGWSVLFICWVPWVVFVSWLIGLFVVLPWQAGLCIFIGSIFAPFISVADKIILAFPGLMLRFTNAPGTARWGNLRDLKEAGLIGTKRDRTKDIYCGMFKGNRVYYGEDRHAVTAGPTRSGKDMRFLVENLRNLNRSVVVMDPKGELAAITANHRRKFGPVLVINPFSELVSTHPHLKSVGFNPLVGLSPKDDEFYSKSMAIAEALGLTLPGASSIPAADSSHPRMCAAAGRRIVDMVWEDLTPERILTPAAFDNAIKVHMAMGGSTNAIIHVIAMARRAGVALDIGRFDRLSREIPVLANVRPSGKYLMEDFFYAGGLRALMLELKDRLDLSCLTVTGKTLAENIDGADIYLRDVIHSLADPIYAEGATAVLTGNLAPRGCVMKPAAADQRFLKHRGPALAFEDYNHMAREIERDDLAVTPDHVIVLKNAGPKGGPGMPEWGMLPIPKKLVQAGVRDMVRISDGRMSGTSYGACILHVSPESYIGGPLAFVQTGDPIEVDVAARTINLVVSDEEMARRKAAWTPPPPRYERGYGAMFSAHIGQADEGCDFDFLARHVPVAEPEIH